jgi:hypothetical protein
MDKSIYVVTKEWYINSDCSERWSVVSVFYSKEKAEKFAKEKNEEQEKYDKLWDDYDNKFREWYDSDASKYSNAEKDEQMRKKILKETGLPEEYLYDFVKHTFSIVEVPFISP